MSNHIELASSIIIGQADMPLDARTRIASLAGIEGIENPFVGMIFYSIAEGKSYVVKTLKAKQIGALEVPDAAIDAYEPLGRDTDSGDNLKHAERLFVAGIGNIAGGIPVRITDYDPATQTVTLAEERPELEVGMQVKVHTSVYDEDSPYDATVTAIDGANVTLEASVLPSVSVLESLLAGGTDAPVLILPVMDAERWSEDESNATIGDYNINTGVGATVTGSINLNNGDYAQVSGSCNLNSGDGATVSGAGNINTGDHADIGGVNNKLIANEGYGRYAFIRGNGNAAKNDNITVIGTGNDVTGMGATVIGSMNKEVTGRDAFAFGNMLKVLGNFAKAWGYQLVNRAYNAFLFGRYGELSDAAENEGAFAIAGGEHNNPLLAWIFRSRKAVLNPLYNPGLDPDGTGADSNGERKYIPKPAFSAQYRGRLTGTTLEITGASGLVGLDHDHYNRWKLTPAANVIPELANWRDGDSGELIVYNGGSFIQWPAEWVWIGQTPELGAVNTFRVWQTGATVYIRDMLVAGSLELEDIDLSAYLTTVDAAALYAPISHSNNSIIHVTSSDKNNWNGKANASHNHTIANVTNLQSVLDGKASSVAIGTTTTGAAGSNADVTNSGTDGAMVLNFVIPRGNKGDVGDVGSVNAVISATEPENPVDGMVWIQE